MVIQLSLEHYKCELYTSTNTQSYKINSYTVSIHRWGFVAIEGQLHACTMPFNRGLGHLWIFISTGVLEPNP